jgi:hypothetical protein
MPVPTVNNLDAEKLDRANQAGDSLLSQTCVKPSYMPAASNLQAGLT